MLVVIVIVIVVIATGWIAMAGAASVVFITASDSAYFDRLENLIGSIHTHVDVTSIKIILYDLGLNAEQLAEITEKKKWCDVRVLSIYKVLAHYGLKRDGLILSDFAWKILIINHALQVDEEVREEERFLYLDAGQEVRRSLQTVINIIDDDGYFFTVNPPWDTCAFTHPTTLRVLREYLNVSTSVCGRSQLAGSVMGFKRKHPDVVKLVKAALFCALLPREDCIAPIPNMRNHRYDQSVWSFLAHQMKLYINPDPQYWLDLYQGDDDHFFLNRLRLKDNLTFFARKSLPSKPYRHKIISCDHVNINSERDDL